MTVRLESLRVTADMDAASYVRGAQQKNAADAQMIASNKAVGQSLAQVDAASDQTSRALQSMSAKWIVGYKDAQNFQKEVAKIGRTLETNTGDPVAAQGRTVAALDGVYRKYGQVADAAQLSASGMVKLAPIVQALNAEYAETARVANLAASAQAEIARRATESATLMSRAQSAQAAINSSLGVGTVQNPDGAKIAKEMADRFAEQEAAAKRYIAALDPLSAAEARHNDNLTEGARLLKLGEITQKQYNTSIATSATSLKKVSDSLDPAIAKQKEMDEATKKLDQDTNRLVGTYDIVGAAQARYNADITTAANLLKAGRIGQEQYNTIVTQAGRVLDDTKKAYEGAYTSVSKYASGTGLARHELVNFSRQAQDVFVSLASGQGVMTVLIQQGTQIVDIFASSRGTVGGFFSQIAPTLLRIAPLAAAAATAVTALYAAITVGGEKNDLSRSLLGSGRGAGLTGGQFNTLAEESAKAANITVSSSRLIAAEYAKLGAVAAGNLPRLTEMTKAYSIVTGQDLKTSAQELARALADPERASEMLAGKIGLLDSTTTKGIRTALTYNDTLRAQESIMQGVMRATDGAIESQSKWERLKAGAGRIVDATLEGAAGLILSKTDEEKRNALLAERAKLQERIKNATVQGPAVEASKGLLQQVERELSVYQKAYDAQVKLAQSRQAEAKDNKISAQAEEAIKPYEDLAARIREASRSYRQLVEARDNAENKTMAIPTAKVDSEEFTKALEEQGRLTAAAANAKRYVDELRAAEAAGGIETYRAAEALKVKNKYLGDSSNAARLAQAEELARVEALVTQTTEEQRNAAARKARNDELFVGTRAIAEEATQRKYATDTAKAETKAIQEQGVESGKLAEIKAATNKLALETGGDAEKLYADALRQRIAEEEKRLAEVTRNTRDANAAAAQANSKALAGGLSASQRADAAEILKIEQSLRDLRAAGVKVDEKGAQARIAAAREEQRVRNTSGGVDLFNQMGQELETLRKQRELIFETHGKRLEELEVMRATQQVREMGLDTESGIGKQVIDRARELGKEKQLTDDILRIRNQIRQAQDFAADSMKSFLSDLLTGTEGLTGALKNLGKGFLSASLDALISGKGPLAGITGLAPATKDGQGGILGALTTGIQGIGKNVKEGAKEGSATGIVSGISAVGGEGGAGLLGIDAKSLTGGLTAIAGLAGAYGVGASAGSYAQAGIGGALSGGMGGLALAGTGIGASLGGAAVLGPIGAALGIGLAVFGKQQADKQRKEELKKQAEANYQAAKGDIATFRSEARGEPQDTLAKRIADAETTARKLADVAYLSGRSAEANEIWLDGQIYVNRALSEYRDGFGGLLDAMQTGLGPNSPFATAKDQIKAFGQELNTFVKNTSTAFGDTAPQVQQAREAAAQYALTVLNGSRSLTVVEQRMAEIQGTGAGLVKVLVDLGWESERAGEAVRAGMTMAIQRVRDAFETDLQAKTNEANDKGYLNDARSLLLEIQQLATDSRMLGTDPDNITRYFQAAAQNLVDEANLTGDAFNAFLKLFPEFTGNVVAAGQALEDASRRLGYLDRLFNATNDTTTLAGQLAAYDRQALREREEEIKLGGQYMVELEAAQQAERYNIIKEFNKAANDNYKQSLQQAQDYIARFTRSIQEYLDGLRAGSDSPLSPQARLAAAQSQYNAQLALAQGGDRNALDGITSYASDLLDAAKGYFASATGFQDIFAQVQNQLGALPAQLRPEQFIVNAIEVGADQTTAAVDAMKIALQSAAASGSASEIAGALSTYFNRIDSNTSATIDFNEMQTALGGMASNSSLRDMFTRIDKDNSGSLDKLELINTATGRVETSSKNQELSLAEANRLSGLVKAVSDQISLYTGQTTHWTNQTNAAIGLSNSQLASLQGIAEHTQATRLNTRAQNQAWGLSGNGYASLGYFADGGYTGPGGKYDPAGIVHKGEIIWSQSDIRRSGGVAAVEAMRTNANFAVPMVPVSGSSNDNRALLAEMRAMRQEIERLRAENAVGHMRTASAAATGAVHVREGLDGVAVNTAAAARAAERKAAA